MAEEEFAFDDLPGFPAPSIPGHARRLVLGRLFGTPAAVFRGRVHLYEGHGIGSTTLIPRLAAGLGARVLILTNAAGGLRPTMRPGQLMVLRDHLNFMGQNPLAGWRFADGTPAFVTALRGLRPRAGRRWRETRPTASGSSSWRACTPALSGPSFETPAETAVPGAVGRGRRGDVHRARGRGRRGAGAVACWACRASRTWPAPRTGTGRC